jgi:hypothetical protein
MSFNLQSPDTSKQEALPNSSLVNQLAVSVSLPALQALVIDAVGSLRPDMRTGGCQIVKNHRTR